MVHPCRSITPKELSPLPCTNCPYHVVPDSPLMYVTQSRRFNFLSPMRLPYSPVIDFSPPPVVMIATTGTCWTEKDGTFTLMALNGLPWGPATVPSLGPDITVQVSFRKERLQNGNNYYCCFPLDKQGIRDWPKPVFLVISSLGKVRTQRNKIKPFCGGNNIFSLYFPFLCHFVLYHAPTTAVQKFTCQPHQEIHPVHTVLLNYLHQCCYSSVSWSSFKTQDIYFEEFKNCNKRYYKMHSMEMLILNSHKMMKFEQ